LADYTARAQQADRVRRVGLLLPTSESNPEIRALLTAFKQRLQNLGWIDGRNVQYDYRFVGESTEHIRTGAKELVAVAPDVIVGYTGPGLAALLRETRAIPIVFVAVSDPVESGFVTSPARPGGNVTGFHNFENAIGGKWLEVLKEIAPGVRRVAVVHNPDITANVAFLHAAEAAPTSLGMTVTAAGVRDAADIESALTAFAREPNGGLIVTPSPTTITKPELIISLAARLGLPAIYPYRNFPTNGGLVSYGFDPAERWQGAASYVDRILHGANPGKLTVQAPTKFKLVINLKTAKALGLTIPPSVPGQCRRGD
jgi:putative ABC transport system substrate-binding protein